MKFLEKLKANKVISALVGWQNSMWYPVVFAALGAVSALFGIYAYVPVFYLHMAGVLFAVLFNDDLKVYFTPLLLIFPSFGMDGLSNFNEGHDKGMPFIEPVGFAQILVCTSVMIIAFIIKLIVTGAFKDIFRKRSTFGFGLLVFAGACLLNGIFSPSWEPIDLAFGALEAMSVTIFYFLFSVVAMRSEDVAAYVCKVMLVLGFMIAAEVGGLSGILAAHNALFDESGMLLRDNIVLGWGNDTVIACMTALTIPASMYVAYSRKRGTLAYFAAVLFFLLTVYLQARNAALFGGILLLGGAIICCISGKNKIPNRYFSAILVGLGIVALAFVINHFGGFDGLFEKLRNMGFMHTDSGDNGRFDRWANGLADFCRSPVFGVGFVDGGVPHDSPAFSPNFYYNMYHNIFIQLIGSMGIVGFIAFLVHFKKVVEVIFTDFSAEKLLLFLFPLGMILMSFLDIYFFLVNMQIYYGVFLTVIEKRSIELRAESAEKIASVPYGKTPKVAVLSACGGDIAETLKSACGDMFDVVNVNLSDRKLLAKAGTDKAVGFKKFMLAVLRFIVGDRLAAKWGVCGVAKREREILTESEFDAVVATDWAAAQIASSLRGKNRVYVATVGGFDRRMDANVNDAFVIGDDYAKAERVSGYACGHIVKAESLDSACEMICEKIKEIPVCEKSEQLF